MSTIDISTSDTKVDSTHFNHTSDNNSYFTDLDIENYLSKYLIKSNYSFINPCIVLALASDESDYCDISETYSNRDVIFCPLNLVDKRWVLLVLIKFKIFLIV